MIITIGRTNLFVYVEWKKKIGNIGSGTMLKKLGCKEEGIRRQMIYTDGKYVDEILFGLLKDEFIKNN